MRRHRQPPVPEDLLRQADEALERVEAAQAGLADVLGGQAPLAVRRSAHAELGRAHDAADALLRRATRLARQHSRQEAAHWRARLSRLAVARQAHLLAEQEDPGVLPLGSVRAVDTGMSGPAIGELQHGRSKAPGTPACYGLDMEALLATPYADRDRPEPEEPSEPGGATVVPLPAPAVGSPPEAA